MTYVVTGRCDKCKYTDCVEVCPTEAFHEGETMLFINPDECIVCDACVPVCPVEAIFIESDVPERFENYIAINAEKAAELPVILEKQDPLEGAKTLEEIKAEEKAS